MTTPQPLPTFPRNDWTPTSNLLSHSGKPLDPKCIFFAPPPFEIGSLLSAYSSFKKNESIFSKLSRTTAEAWQGSLMFAVIVAIVPILLIGLIPGARLVAGIIGLLAGLGTLCFFLWASLMPTCSYVGTRGFAKFTFGRNEAQLELCEFAKAARLQADQSRNYRRGMYQGTSYNFTWYDVEGKEAGRVWGMYYNEQGTPPDKNDATLAFAAQDAWYAFERARVNAR